MPTSNVTRVRSDGFSKIMASVWPRSAPLYTLRVRLHLPAQREQILNFRGREISDRKKIFTLHLPPPARAGLCSRVNLASISARPGLVSSSTS